MSNDNELSPEEALPEMSTEDKISALYKEMKELQATEAEDAYALNVVAVQKFETGMIYSGMNHTDDGIAKAKQDWDAERKKYQELALLGDKKRLRLERIKLDVAALQKEKERTGSWC